MQRIRGAIIDGLRSLDWVPRSVRSRARDIEAANSKLEHELGRAPTDAELAGRLKMSQDDLQEAFAPDLELLHIGARGALDGS